MHKFIILVIVTFLIFPASIALGSLGYMITFDKSGEFVKLTSYGFAIFVGISSMLFTWARAMNEKEKKFITNLNNSAANSVMCAVLFLAISLIRYSTTIDSEKLSMPGVYQIAQSKIYQFPMYIFLIVIEVMVIKITWSIVEVYVGWKYDDVSDKIVLKRKKGN